MPSKDTTLDLHKTLAHEIKAAKKAMFKRNREGQSIANSANTFVWDVQNRLHKIINPGQTQRVRKGSPLDHVTATLPDGREVEMYGDAVDIAEKENEPKTPRAQLAAAILEILTNQETPDELKDAVAQFASSASDGPIVQYWMVPGSLRAMEHLLNFVAWKEANCAEN